MKIFKILSLLILTHTIFISAEINESKIKNDITECFWNIINEYNSDKKTTDLSLLDAYLLCIEKASNPFREEIKKLSEEKTKRQIELAIKLGTGGEITYSDGTRIKVGTPTTKTEDKKLY